MPLNVLRALEASVQHLSFVRAAIELCMTRVTVSHQVESPKEHPDVVLFKRLPRGLMLTHEGESLPPVLCDLFDRTAGLLERPEGGRYRGVLTVGMVGIFTVGWLLLWLEDLQAYRSFVDLHLSAHSNCVDIATEGLDCAIRFGGDVRYSTEALALFGVSLTVLCCPEVAAQLHSLINLLQHTLLHSYHADE